MRKHLPFLFANGLRCSICTHLYYLGMLLLLMLIFPSFCLSEEKNFWDNEDKELFATFGTLMAVDMMQTRYVFEHEEYRETNPIINNYFNDEKAYGYFALTGLGAYLIADNLRPEYRKSFLRFLCMVQIGVTNNNASIGIGFSF